MGKGASLMGVADTIFFSVLRPVLQRHTRECHTIFCWEGRRERASIQRPHFNSALFIPAIIFNARMNNWWNIVLIACLYLGMPVLSSVCLLYGLTIFLEGAEGRGTSSHNPCLGSAIFIPIIILSNRKTICMKNG